MYGDKKNEYIDVLWKDIGTRRNFKIGTLSKNGQFIFKYCKDGVVEAQKNGFKSLVAFPNFSVEYTNKDMFPVFENRLPDKRRKDLPKILETYGLNEYDAFELLKKTGGKTPTDTLSFAEPIILERDGKIEREFYVAGVRHCEVCTGIREDKCTVKIDFYENEQLELVQEKNNPIDKYAILLYKENYKVGYIPINYSKAVSQAIEEKRNIECTVKYFDPNNCCQECLKVLLKIN